MLTEGNDNQLGQGINVVRFWDYMSMGRPHWRGQTSRIKSGYFFLLGSPDAHTRLRNSYVINEIERLNFPVDCKVLEGGCGRAVTLFWLAQHHPEWEFTGIELDPVLAQSAQKAVHKGKMANIGIIEGDILALNEQQAYDLIICIDILEHIENDVGLLQRYWQALKPGGYLVLHVPRRHQEMWRWLPVFQQHGVIGHVREDDDLNGVSKRVVIEGHVREEYTLAELQLTSEAAGFSIVGARETIGRLGEVAFELNNLLWPWPSARYLLALLTYPIAMSLGYMDVRRNSTEGNSLLLVGRRD